MMNKAPCQSLNHFLKFARCELKAINAHLHFQLWRLNNCISCLLIRQNSILTDNKHTSTHYTIFYSTPEVVTVPTPQQVLLEQSGLDYEINCQVIFVVPIAVNYAISTLIHLTILDSQSMPTMLFPDIHALATLSLLIPGQLCNLLAWTMLHVSRCWILPFFATAPHSRGALSPPDRTPPEEGTPV